MREYLKYLKKFTMSVVYFFRFLVFVVLLICVVVSFFAAMAFSLWLFFLTAFFILAFLAYGALFTMRDWIND